MDKVNVRELFILAMFLLTTVISIGFYNQNIELRKTIEEKDKEIEDLTFDNSRCNMAYDEFYELFMDCNSYEKCTE